MRTMLVLFVLLVGCVDEGQMGVPGPQGIQGEHGVPGEAGPKGDQGIQGLQGIPGLDGLDGLPGEVGEQGPAGPQGSMGPQGAQGPQGPVGATGSTGATGAQGLQGATGPKGDKGDQGDQGPAGWERMVYVDDEGELLGLATSALMPNDANQVAMMPAFYSEGGQVDAGWVVSMAATTIWYSGTGCTGVPYVKNGQGLELKNMVYWTPGSGLLGRWWDKPVTVMTYVGSYKHSNGSCAAVGNNQPDLLPLIAVDNFQVLYSLPWSLKTEGEL